MGQLHLSIEGASSPITLDVSDSGVASTDTLRRATTTGVGSETGSVASGVWSAAFTDDPGFILLRSTNTGVSGTTSSSTSSTTTNTAKPIGPDLEISSLKVKRTKHPKLSIRATTRNIGDHRAPRTITAIYTPQGSPSLPPVSSCGLQNTRR
jgi:hypothetical protein